MLDKTQLLNKAIEASGMSNRRFAWAVLAVDERTVRRWLSGEADIPGPALQLCQAIIADPRIVKKIDLSE